MFSGHVSPVRLCHFNAYMLACDCLVLKVLKFFHTSLRLMAVVLEPILQTSLENMVDSKHVMLSYQKWMNRGCIM